MRRWIVVAALVAACGKGSDNGKGSPVDKLMAEKLKMAKLDVRKLAFEAYAQFLGDHPSKSCPDSLKDLTPYMNDDHVSDPWGNPYAMKCEPSPKGHGYDFRVISAGPDGKMGTDDDLDSSTLKNGD